MDKSLRILVVGSAWPPETFIEHLLHSLLTRGLQITVASAKRPASSWLENPGFIWLSTSSWEGNPLLRMARFAWKFAIGFLHSRKDIRTLALRINTVAARSERLRLWDRLLPFVGQRWDAIYFPWNSAAVEHLLLFDLGMPVVISCRGSQVNIAPHNPLRAALRDGLKETFARATTVHCVSQKILLEAMQFGLPFEKARVIHPAVDMNFFWPLSGTSIFSNKFRILTIGSLVWVKGLEYALLALQKLRQAGVPLQFDIIGSGADEARIRFTIYDLGLEDCVNLLGRKSPEHVRDALQQSDVFLLSSLSEGISNAVLEAMACGIPVVSTDCGGMREAVTDGVEGFVVPLRDPAAMASALIRLWQDPNLRKQMGRAGRQRVLCDFNMEQQIQQWIDLYQGLLMEGGI